MKNILILFIFITSFSFSQKENEVLIPKHQFSFSLGVNLHQKLEIKSIGEEQYSSFAYPFPDIGFEFKKHIFKSIGLQVGFHVSLDMITERFTIFNNENLLRYSVSPNLEDKSIEIFYPMFYFPLFLEVNLWERNSFLFTSSIGMKFNNFFPVDLTSTFSIGDDTTDNQIFKMRIESVENQEKRWFTSYCLKFGITKFTKKMRTFSFNVSINYTPEIIREGVFAFDLISNPSHGTIKQRNNYIGFELSYGFGKKRKIKPADYTLF